MQGLQRKMLRFSDITEATGKIVFAFGRFNPPTTGHEKLITKVAQISGSDPYRIYPSLTQNPKKDPLPHALKVAYMRKMFSKHSRNIIADKKAVTAIDIAVKLYDEGFKDLVMVAGSDRIKEFDSLLNRYNGVTGKRHGYYKFNTISVVSAGERDPDAEGVTGMSASKMRAAAVEGDEKSFAMGVPKGFRDVSKLFQDVRKNMGIREDRDMGSMTDFESVRDAYLVGKVWNVGDLIEANGITGIIIRKGTNYVSYNDGNGKVHKAWLHDITLDERNYAKEYANYQGTPEQIARRSSRNKARRIMGDKATQGMDVGHKDNDPLNNDPKNLKMEDPSKNRREPRLREKSDLDEIPMAILKVKNAIAQMTHPKEYDSMVKKYVRYMSEPKPYASKGVIINDIVKQHKSSGSPKGFQQYINKLVSKGKLPKELSANKINEAKGAVSGGKVQKWITGNNVTFQGKKYKKVDLETLKIDNNSKTAEVRFWEPKELKGKIVKIRLQYLRRGPFMATDIPNQFEVLGKGADMGDYIDDFQKSDAPQFKGKSKEKRKDMAIAAFKSKEESMNESPESLKNKADGKSVNEWFQANATRAKYQLQHGDDWWWKMNETHDAMLEKLGLCCDDCLDEAKGPCWDGFKQVGMKMKGGKEVPNCVPESMSADEAKKIEGYIPEEVELDEALKFTHAVVDPDGKVAGMATNEKEAKDIASRHKGKVVKLKKPMAQKKGDMMINRPFKESKLVNFNQFESLNAWGELPEDDKSGKKLNNPTRGDVKKYKVYVKNDKGNVVKVEFGDPNMSIKRDDPARRKAFRARHNCDNPGPKYKARYWSCKFWSTKSVTDLMKG